MSPPSSNLLQTDSHDADGHLDSSCSTPYASAPSSPGRGPLTSFFFSAPASPMHFILSSSASLSYPSPPPPPSAAADLRSEFDFSARLPPTSASVVGSMTSADQLFHNGQIRPMELQNPQALPPPTMDLDGEDDESKEPPAERGHDSLLRSRSVHRRTRSMSPMRKSSFEWPREQDDRDEERVVSAADRNQPEETDASMAPIGRPCGWGSASAPTSRSSSMKGSKRWTALKDFLYRSKSEGRGRGSGKEKFWQSLSFSPSSSSREKKSTGPLETTARGEKEKGKSQLPPKAGKGTGGNKRRGPAPSPHEALYTANRAQAEVMKKKTFLPYRQGLLGCLGFSSKSYGAWNGFAKTLNPISSR